MNNKDQKASYFTTDTVILIVMLYLTAVRSISLHY